MKTTYFRSLFLAACTCLIISLFSVQTQAANYGFLDLGIVNGIPQDYSQAFAINSSGQVTGEMIFGLTPGERAFFYDGTNTQNLGTMYSGTISRGTGVNDLGHVAGTSTTLGNVFYTTFLYNGTTKIDLGTLGGTNSFSTAINNQDKVVGFSNTETGIGLHAFMHDGNAMIDLGTLGGRSSFAQGINNHDLVVGYSEVDMPSNIRKHAFLFDGTTMHSLGTLGGTSSYASQINDLGQIVGSSETIPNNTAIYHAFLWQNDVMQDLGTLGGSYSSAGDINENGQIVGASAVNLSGNPLHAFIYDSVNGMVDLNTLVTLPNGWYLQSASAINDNGQIVGTAISNNGQSHAFLITPIPEPSTILFGAIAILGFCQVFRGRNNG